MRVSALRAGLFFLKSHRALFAGILLVTLFTSFLEGLNVAAFLPLFHSLLDPTSAVPQGGIHGLIARLNRQFPFRDPVSSAAMLVVVVMACKAGLAFLREALVARGSAGVLYDVKNRLMERYGRSSYQFFLDTKQGTLLYHCLIAPHKVAILALRLPQLAAELLTIVAIVSLLFVTWPMGAWGLVLITLLYNGFIQALSRRISYLTGKGRLEADSEQAAVSNEFFTGIRQITAFQTAGHWLGRFKRANRQYTALYMQDALWLAVPQHLMELTAVLLLVGVVVLLKGAGQATLQASLPVLGVFSVALLRLLPSVNSFGRKRMEILSTLADAERVHAELTEPSAPRQEGGRALETIRRGIAFEDVSFAHLGRPPLLSGLTFAIQPGKVTAIVGPSGAGKSTLINLLLGLFEPRGGRITVDGLPLRAYRPEAWLGQIGFVSQDPFLFHGTVADNILFGRTGLTSEAILKAAQVANAHEFITELPQGYETVVGERGMKLSGGQQQRIAIARAVLENPQVLIFDEATSHLDAVAERQVQDAIERVSTDRTVIIVAHRLSTLKGADHIFVLDRGRIVEAGSHEELLGEQGRYARLVASGSP